MPAKTAPKNDAEKMQQPALPDPNADEAKGKAPQTGSMLEAQTLYVTPYYRDTYNFPYNPDTLCAGNKYDIYDEMRNDDQVKAAITFKKDILVNCGWRVICDNEAAKQFATEQLENLESNQDLDTSFEDALRDMLSAYEYGFSMTEPVWKLKDNMYQIESLKTRPPHGFQFHLDDWGNIEKIVQFNNKGQIDLKPSVFLHHVYQPDWGNPYGRSDMKAIHPLWKSKKFVMKFLAIYLERFAGPTVVGRFPDTWDTNQISKFHDMLKTIQNATSLGLPMGAMVEFVQANKDSSDIYIRALNFYNMDMARGVLVPDLMGISGEKTSGGAYSLGKEHFKLFYGTIQKDRDSLARKITSRILRPMIEANFGDVDCKFEFLPFTVDDELEYQKLWVDAVKGKIWDPNEDEINHLRAALKFPEGPVNITQAPDPMEMLQAKSALDQGKNLKPNDKTKDPKAEEKQKKLSLRIYRELSSFEKKVDFALAEETLDKGEAYITPRLSNAAKKVWSDYISRIKDSGLLRNFRPERLNELEPRHLKDMQQVLKTYLGDMFKRAFNEAQEEIFPEAEKKFARQADEYLIPEEMLRVLNADSFNIVGDYKNLFTKKVKNILFEGLKTGLSESQMVDHIKSILPDETERWLSTMVRTKTTEVFNRGRKSYWDSDPEAQQIIEAYMFSAVMDERTSDVCRSLDGKIFQKGDFTNDITPPLHFNCRSVIVPVTKFENYEESKQYVEPGKEPDLSDLKDLGGNLIIPVTDDEKARAFKMEDQNQ